MNITNYLNSAQFNIFLERTTYGLLSSVTALIKLFITSIIDHHFYFARFRTRFLLCVLTSLLPVGFCFRAVSGNLLLGIRSKYSHDIIFVFFNHFIQKQNFIASRMSRRKNVSLDASQKFRSVRIFFLHIHRRNPYVSLEQRNMRHQVFCKISKGFLS